MFRNYESLMVFLISQIGVNVFVCASSRYVNQTPPTMEKFVIHGQNKRSCSSDAVKNKKIKREKYDRIKEEEEKNAEEDENEFSHPVPWEKIEAEGLDCDYALLFSKEEADQLFKQLEEEVVYSTGTILTLFVHSYDQRSQRS